MSTSLQRQLIKLILVSVCPLLGPPLAAAPTAEEYVARAMQVLRGLFPQLTQANVVISYRAILSSPNPLHNRDTFHISLYRSHNPTVGDLSARSESLFDSMFQFHTNEHPCQCLDHQLKQLMNVGPFISDRVERLKKEVDSHPEWPDAQVVAALKSSGAKFGPDSLAEFIRALPLRALEPVTGRLEVVSAKFGIRFDRVAEDKPPEADLSWTVDAKWHSKDGQYEADYILTFEPFNGALENLDFRGPKPIRP